MYQIDYDWKGFEWLVADDYLQNILVYERRDADDNRIVAIINFSPVPHEGYRFGAHKGEYTELLRTEIYRWGCSGAKYSTENIASHGKECSLSIDIPPMGGILLYCPNKKSKASKPATEKTAEVAAKKSAAEKTATAKPAAKKVATENAASTQTAKKPAPATKTAAKKTAAKPATKKTPASKSK